MKAHLELKGELLVPIHWGKFNLSIHPWMEPIERVTTESRNLAVKLRVPVIGELVLGD